MSKTKIAFIPGEAKNAKFRKGARIVKVACEEGDANPVGTMGTVLASHEHPAFGVGYFVEWDMSLP